MIRITKSFCGVSFCLSFFHSLQLLQVVRCYFLCFSFTQYLQNWIIWTPSPKEKLFSFVDLCPYALKKIILNHALDKITKKIVAKGGQLRRKMLQKVDKKRRKCSKRRKKRKLLSQKVGNNEGNWCKR